MKLFKLFFSIFVGISSVISLPQSLPTIITQKYSVDFNGESGGFKIKNNFDDTFYNMKYGWISETSSNKLKLDFTDFNFGSNENVTYVDTELNDNTFHIKIKNEIWKINSEYINEKNQTVIVDKDNMKLTILMYGWNFLNLDNNLTLDFTLSNNIGNSISNVDNTTIRVKDFNFYFEPIVIVDDEEKIINFYTYGNKYYIVFPSFSKDLFYDPTISYTKDFINISTNIYIKSYYLIILTFINLYLNYANL